MIDAFKHGQDIHAATAAKVYHVPLEEVTPQMRSSCKAVNFGIVYGISDFSLAQDIGVTRKGGAASLSKTYLDTLSGREEIYGGHQADRQGAGLRYDPVRPPPRAARAEEQELQYALVR